MINKDQIENFPNLIKGNDDIVWKKMKVSKGSINYEPFWRGYSIDVGGFFVNTKKELNDLISNYILSIDMYNLLKHKQPKTIREGYGAGFSFSGGSVKGMGGTSRGGFGGANNLGGPNMMYTYEIKPLNHALEQKPSDVADQVPQIQVGSNVSGIPFRSNANPTPKRIKGIIKKIVKTDDNSLKYYIIQSELSQNLVKIDPLTTTLIIHEPIEHYFDNTDTIPSRRKEKIKKHMKESKYVPETLDELNEMLKARLNGYSYKNWINEEFIKHLKLNGNVYEIIKNPLPYEIPAWERAIADGKGNIWVAIPVKEDDPPAIHLDIFKLAHSIDNTVESPYTESYKGISYIQGNSIAIQRFKNEDVFVLGESYVKSQLDNINQTTWEKTKQKNKSWIFVYNSFVNPDGEEDE